ncbi:MAG: methyltransferase type 11 [Bacteroidetes bacterium]|nr:MAG: methyltransferase type 11 [Bacteroidota bacterium]
MKYDPIKKSLGKVFNTTPFLRKLFYKLLDTLLLRTWHVKREIKKWGKSHKNSQAYLLDAGSGFGQYSYYMASKNKNWQVKGVDVKQEQIDDCNRFFSKANLSNAQFSYADLTQFDEPNTYDFVLSVDVMEHILEDEQVFKNLYQSLKPGGMILISTPSDQGGSDVHDHDHEGESFIDEHVRDGYNINDIQEKLKRAGFQRTEAKYSYGLPGKISWRLSMKYPILLLNASKIFFIILPFYYLVTMPFALILNAMDVRQKHKTGTGLIVKGFKA